MHLVELLLPLNDNSGLPFGAEKYDMVRQQLTERFGGLTAFPRSPAQGSTKGDGKTVHDEIIVFEVMTKTLDVSWWGHYRLNLEREFRQDEILVRASTLTVLWGSLAQGIDHFFMTLGSRRHFSLAVYGARELRCW